MMPHLGVLSTVNEQAATEVFERDCLVYLGTCVAPKGEGSPGEACMNFSLDLPSGKKEGVLRVGDMRLLPLGGEEEAQISLIPVRDWDLGNGPGQEVISTVRGGVVGVVLDGRGRPIQIAEDRDERLAQITAWHQTLKLYEGD